MGNNLLALDKMRTALASLIAVTVVVAAAAHKKYDGYKVLRTEKLNATSFKILNKVQETTNYVDFWADPVPGRRADMMVGGDLLTHIENFLSENGIQYHTMVDDVQGLIDEVEQSRTRKAERRTKDYELDWEDYYEIDVLNQFLDALAEKNDFAEVLNIGKSYEGRDMKVLAITKAGPGAPNVWLESGIHAREWIAPAVATFIVRELVEDYEEHPEYLDKINWYFLPSANPDGYAYSWEHDRLWRKTRSDNGGLLHCKGVDGNRNWDFHFGESGVSHNKCFETYLGPAAFSEVETQNIRDFVLSLDPVPVWAHTFHSYSQLWLWPYGYAHNAFPDNKEELHQLAIDASEALFKVHGTRFDPINSADLYPAAGASDDWYKGVLGSRFSFTTELRDTGAHGFLLPKDQIIPSGEEMWAGFQVVIAKILETTE